ncbi:MAG: RnfABCDGE type electron transport complex subunit G [Deltaproteobacteria bacterium]|nr:RnfABCDGE type electron transport complex subunit G [Deltaproteobacteria bacterium]MBW2075150.1 RnfABCDGE type electron transport complex subunit G [Deltaproteobacteria bacterium]RLB81026.1 MAG: electron transporter RnfG [Deltaproteobacteria bacterium]
MRDIIRMIVVLAVLCALSGGLLAAVKSGTAEKIEYQQLKFVKGPAIKEILKGCSNDPIVDRFKLQDGDVERSFFVGVFDGKPNSVAYETFGKGFGGPIGIMVGVNLETDKVIGMGVTTHSETPGLGARAKTDETFKGSFKGLSINEPVKVKTDGGEVDAVTGATITSRGVCAGITESAEFYKRLKPQIVEKAKAFAK